jgi:hypothetical protein
VNSKVLFYFNAAASAFMVFCLVKILTRQIDLAFMASAAVVFVLCAVVCAIEIAKK